MRDVRPHAHGQSELYCGTFIASPYYTHRQNDPNDLAVVVFEKPIRNVGTATVVDDVGYLDTLFAEGELDQSSEFISVGYGGTEFTNLPTRRTDCAVPRYQDVRHRNLQRARSRLHPDLTKPGNGGRGHLLRRLRRATVPGWRLVSITVTGDVFCKSTNVVQRLDTEKAQEFITAALRGEL